MSPRKSAMLPSIAAEFPTMSSPVGDRVKSGKVAFDIGGHQMRGVVIEPSYRGQAFSHVPASSSSRAFSCVAAPDGRPVPEGDGVALRVFRRTVRARDPIRHPEPAAVKLRHEQEPIFDRGLELLGVIIAVIDQNVTAGQS